MAKDQPVIYVTDPQVAEERLHHEAAHRARMAHRLIRLRELGFGGTAVKDLGSVDVDDSDEVQAGGGGASRLIKSVLDGAAKDRPGPTADSGFVKSLLNLDRSDLFSTWKENADEAASEFDSAGFVAAVESEARDRQAAEEADEEMRQGDWIRQPYVPHGGDIPWAANAMYDLAREGFLAGEIDWDTAVIKVDLVDTGAYTIDLATHKFRSSIASGARVASSAALTAKTVTAGVADAGDVAYPLLTGTSVELIVGYQASAVGGGADVADTAQRLVFALDTATGLPFTPTGGDINLVWDNTTNRIFKLG